MSSSSLIMISTFKPGQNRVSEGHRFRVVTNHPKYGSTIEVDDDTSTYLMQPGQKFVPHVIPDSTHPASVGDMVTLNSWLAKHLGVSVAFVSRVRTFKSGRKENGNRQVELLGLPCQWFAISHFEEYKGKQIYHHIWGNFANIDVDEIPIIVIDKNGETHKGRPVQPVILPNL